jgi:hypothetical protein
MLAVTTWALGCLSVLNVLMLECATCCRLAAEHDAGADACSSEGLVQYIHGLSDQTYRMYCVALPHARTSEQCPAG